MQDEVNYHTPTISHQFVFHRTIRLGITLLFAVFTGSLHQCLLRDKVIKVRSVNSETDALFSEKETRNGE